MPKRNPKITKSYCMDGTVLIPMLFIFSSGSSTKMTARSEPSGMTDPHACIRMIIGQADTVSSALYKKGGEHMGVVQALGRRAHKLREARDDGRRRVYALLDAHEHVRGGRAAHEALERELYLLAVARA